jgi:hypothetical protein
MIGQADVGMGNSQEITGSPQNCVSFWQRFFFPKLQVASLISACIAHCPKRRVRQGEQSGTGLQAFGRLISVEW